MRYFGIAIAAAAVASCGSGDGNRVGGDNVAAAKPAESGRPIDLEPGSWRTQIALLEFEQPGGFDPDGADTRQMVESLSGRDRCFAPDAVRNADLPETLSSGPWRGGNCRYSRRAVTTAGVDIAMDCEGMVPGHRLQTSVRGTASPRATDLVIESRSRHPNSGAAWLERYRVRSTWQSASCARR
jgi:hypothetical protein